MLSSVLRSKTAIAVNIEIMRAFVELRRVASSYAALEERLEQVERGMGEHDEQLEQIFNALRQLIASPVQQKQPVGFRIRDE
jgi:DNA topoisomerase IA